MSAWATEGLEACKLSAATSIWLTNGATGLGTARRTTGRSNNPRTMGHNRGSPALIPEMERFRPEDRIGVEDLSKGPVAGPPLKKARIPRSRETP